MRSIARHGYLQVARPKKSRVAKPWVSMLNDPWPQLPPSWGSCYSESCLTLASLPENFHVIVAPKGQGSVQHEVDQHTSCEHVDLDPSQKGCHGRTESKQLELWRAKMVLHPVVLNEVKPLKVKGWSRGRRNYPSNRNASPTE